MDTFTFGELKPAIGKSEILYIDLIDKLHVFKGSIKIDDEIKDVTVRMVDRNPTKDSVVHNFSLEDRLVYKVKGQDLLVLGGGLYCTNISEPERVEDKWQLVLYDGNMKHIKTFETRTKARQYKSYIDLLSQKS